MGLEFAFSFHQRNLFLVVLELLFQFRQLCKVFQNVDLLLQRVMLTFCFSSPKLELVEVVKFLKHPHGEQRITL